MRADHDVRRLLQTTRELPPMPLVAQRVLVLTGREDASPAELQRVIAADPALAARVLRAANSPLFARARGVATLGQAVLVLGFATLRSLVMAAAVRALLLGAGREVGLRERLLWEHALGCALAARVLAARLGLPDPEPAFLGGLLHDIGKLALGHCFPDAYARVFQVCYNEGRAAEAVEIEHLGLGHTAAGALLVRQWHLPEEIADVVAGHHGPDPAAINLEVTAIVHFANLACEHLGIGGRPRAGLDLCAAPSAPVLGLGAGAIDEFLRDTAAAYEEERRAFD